MKNWIKQIFSVRRPVIVETEKIDDSFPSAKILELLESGDVSLGSGMRLVNILLRRLVEQKEQTDTEVKDE